MPGKPRLRHAARPVVKARFPMHVTKRIRPGVTRLRRFELCKVLQRAFVHGCLKTLEAGIEFRICQFSIQGNHIHLICEASSNDALSRGVQGWSVRVARGVNGHLGREGSLFDDRYHVAILTTPMQTRNTLCYVLQNARRHGDHPARATHGRRGEVVAVARRLATSRADRHHGGPAGSASVSSGIKRHLLPAAQAARAGRGAL